MPTIVTLHCLGGSSRTWQPVIARLPELPSVTIDLPGFGEAGAVPGDTVEDMVDAAAAAIRSAGVTDWIVVGHSMGAKIATVLARRAEDGDRSLRGLRGAVLVAGSPPSPEPMEESVRAQMLGWFQADEPTHRAQAQQFVDQNVGAPLPAAVNALAVDDVLRADRRRWRAWLTGGSKEDWSARVGTLALPALIVAGEDDAALGPAAQARLTAPHFTTVRQINLPGAKHLLPLERADALAALIAEHAA